MSKKADRKHTPVDGELWQVACGEAVKVSTKTAKADEAPTCGKCIALLKKPKRKVKMNTTEKKLIYSSFSVCGTCGERRLCRTTGKAEGLHWASRCADCDEAAKEPKKATLEARVARLEELVSQLTSAAQMRADGEG